MPRNLSAEIRQVSIGCQFLDGGLDWAGDAQIFTVDDGVAYRQTMVGWAVIGSGAHNALASLMFQEVNSEMDLATAIYHACEAKFMSEAAPGVGQHTNVVIVDPGFSVKESELSDSVKALIRGDWEKEGRPRIPAHTLTGLRGILQRRNAPTQSAPPDPQPTTADPSGQQPSPESPGGFDVP